MSAARLARVRPSVMTSLKAAVDRLGAAVGGAGAVEVGQDVGGSLVQRPAERDDLAQGGRNVVADGGDQPGHELAALGPVGFAVGSDHALVDGPGGLDLDVLVGGEQVVEACALSGGEQVSAG